MLGLGPAEAFDAALVTGGLPLVCAEWPHGAGLWDFLGGVLSDPVSALLVSAERSLAEKRIVAAELPVSLRPSRDRRYRVADSYLRFWLHLLAPSMEEIERGRGDLTLARVRDNWTSWRGRAVEPLVREALGRMLPDERLPAAPAVGGYCLRPGRAAGGLAAVSTPLPGALPLQGAHRWCVGPAAAMRTVGIIGTVITA